MKINIGINRRVRIPHRKFSIEHLSFTGVSFKAKCFEDITGRMVLDWCAKNHPGWLVTGWSPAEIPFYVHLLNGGNL